MSEYLKKVVDIIPAAGSESLDLKNLAGNTKDRDNKGDTFAKVSPLELQNNVPMFGGLTSKHGNNGLDDLMSEILEGGIGPKEEIEALMSDVSDPVAELARAGVVIGKTGKWQGNLKTKDGYSETMFGSETSKHENELSENFYKKIISHIRAPATRAAINLSSVKSPEKPKIEVGPRLVSAQNEARAQLGRIVYENQIADFYKVPITSKLTKAAFAKAAFVSGKQNFNFAPPPRKNYSTLLFIFFGILGVLAYGATLKHELVRDSSLAIGNLEKAGESLKNFDFSNAAENFRRSYDDLTQASRNLNLAGAGLAGIFADVPGFGKLKSAKDIVEAGKLLAGAGESMSEAMGVLSQTGTFLDPTAGNKAKPSRIIRQLKDALALSGKNLGKAKTLLATIDESVIPEDKKEIFHDFKDKIPMFEKLLSDSQEYVDFLEGIIGIDEQKKYLLLFNNYSELRPTGGFPGTYGIISFSNGGLENFFVDDVYNLDGQLKENIIPPKPLQHITPNLGMRDSAWFIDFPSSARKAMSFFAKETGYKVNGVVTLNPDVILDILRVIGPINMPEYGMSLTADNFLESIQEEVEYGPNRTQPKTVVVDLAPKLLAKLYSATPEKWMKIFNSWMDRLEEKDILFYLEDKELESFAVKERFGGEIRQTEGDYLAVNFSNIKGSKTDAVTDSSIEIDNKFEDGQVVHKVTIARNHKGGDHEHGFYNRQNPAYVRVLVPENAELLSISGNDSTNFRPLINYALQGDFERDRDLVVFESGFSGSKFAGVDMFKESGKKGIGFWMITEPGTTKKVEFEYSVPATGKTCDTTGLACGYSFYFQKQPGLDWKNFKFLINNEENIREVFPEFNRVGDTYILDTELKKDIEIKLKLK